MIDKDWSEQIAIHVDSRTGEPKVVYIDDVDLNAGLLATVINSSEVYFVDKSELLDFGFKVFRRLHSDWKLKDLKRQVRMIELRKSL